MVFYEHCRVIAVQIQCDGEVFVHVEIQHVDEHYQIAKQPNTQWVPYTDCFFRGTYDQLNRSANIIDTMRRASGIVPAKEQCGDLSTNGYAIIRTMLLEMLADNATNSNWIATAIQQSTPDQLTNVLTDLIPSRLVSNLQAHRRSKLYQWFTDRDTRFLDLKELPKTIRELTQLCNELVDRSIVLPDVIHAILTKWLRSAEPGSTDTAYQAILAQAVRQAETPDRLFPSTINGVLGYWSQLLTHIRQSEPSTVDDDIDTSSKHQALAVTPKGGGGGKGRGKGDRKRPRAKSDDKPPGDDVAERTCTECETKFKPQMTFHKYCTKCQAERNKKLRPSKKTEADQKKTAPPASPKPKPARRPAPTGAANAVTKGKPGGATASSSRADKKTNHLLGVFCQERPLSRAELQQILSVNISASQASHLPDQQTISFEANTDSYGELHIHDDPSVNPKSIDAYIAKDATDTSAPRIRWLQSGGVEVETVSEYIDRTGRKPKCNLGQYGKKVKRAYMSISAEVDRNPNGPIASEAKAWYDTFIFDDDYPTVTKFKPLNFGIHCVATYMCSDDAYGDALRKFIAEARNVSHEYKAKDMDVRILCDSCATIALLPYSLLSQEQQKEIDPTKKLNLLRAGNDPFTTMGPIPSYTFNCEKHEQLGTYSGLRLVWPQIVDDRDTIHHTDTLIILIPAGPMCTASLSKQFSKSHPSTPSVMLLDDRRDGEGCYLQRPNGTRLKLYMDTDGMPSFRLDPSKHSGAAPVLQADDGSDGSPPPSPKRRKSAMKKDRTTSQRV